MPVRTSTSDPIRVDFLPFPLPGRVGLTFAPGKCGGSRWQRSLPQDLDRLQGHYGVAHLVSLIEDHELAQYGIGNLYAEAERRGIGARGWLSGPRNVLEVTHAEPRSRGLIS